MRATWGLLGMLALGCSGANPGPLFGPAVVTDEGGTGEAADASASVDATAGGGQDAASAADADLRQDGGNPTDPADAASDGQHCYSCSELGFTCGAAYDRCGTTLNCGTCEAGSSCEQVGSAMVCVTPEAGPPPKCDSKTCAGCCDGTTCRSGMTDDACGTQGAYGGQCLACSSGTHCKPAVDGVYDCL